MKQTDRNLLFLLTAFTAALPAFAQEAKPAVVASCGGSSQDITGYTIQFTVGEAVIITAENNAILTQGFHQPLSAMEYPTVSLNLQAVIKNNYVQLTWTTSAEIDNDQFFIERSGNGINFTIIDSVRTKALNGNSNTPLHYTYTDLQPLNGANYYRLKQVDKNGRIHYSAMVQVNFSGAAWRAGIYPNPVRGTLFIQLFSDRQSGAAITLHSLTGQLLLKREWDLPTGYSRQTLELGHLKAGMYVLTIIDRESKRKIITKLVKQY